MAPELVTVTVDGRTVEVETGSNLVDAALKAGVQIPHYCYHPRLSVVGQCRMCLVKIDGIGKLQTGCTTQVMKEGMVVHVDDEEVRAAQEGMMEFLLINHPLDCPICDQAGECGLQDYSFKHGQAFSRFAYEDKRTYPGKERIPLGPNVLLNMNRCIQCTRCVRFTEEVSKTSELGFFERGSRAEIGVFPGKELDNDLSTCVVDICPVGALTSTKFRFAERVWYLDKKPSICTGCDAGCNITIEHRRGKIRRYKPRLNEQVNDHWMCDYGRTSFEPYAGDRVTAPRRRAVAGGHKALTWDQALETVHHALGQASAIGTVGILARGSITTEEAYVLARLADSLATPHRDVLKEDGPERIIPTPSGNLTGRETTPNRRGAAFAGLRPTNGAIDASGMMSGKIKGHPSAIIVFDGGPEGDFDQPDTIQGLREAEELIVIGWRDSPLAQVADLVLPITTHAENSGSFVNSNKRLQKFEPAFPAPAGVLPGVRVLSDMLRRFRPDFAPNDASAVFALMADSLPALADLTFEDLPASGTQLPVRPE